MAEYKVTIEKEIKITQEDIDDIMCSALEGGITYWCCHAEVVDKYLGEWAHEQIARGGALKLHDAEEDEVYELTLEKFLNGLQKAITDGYYADYEWVTGDCIDTCQVDAEVADAIVQLALFDEIVFG